MLMLMMMMMMMMLVMMMMMTMMMVVMMMMRRRWWCECWGGGRWWCWGGWCWGGRPIPRPGSAHFVRACAVEMRTWTCAQEPFCMENLRGKCRTVDISGASILRELAQSKCTWTCHKRHFVRKFTGKMPDASDATSIEHRPLTVTVRTLNAGRVSPGKHFLRACAVEMHMDMSQAAFCAEIFK